MNTCKNELTEQEKWECTVRWLNVLYSAHFYLQAGYEVPLEVVDGCLKCPFYDKCPSNYHVTDDGLPDLSKMIPIPMNFKVLEQFTGTGTVVGPAFGSKGVSQEGIILNLPVWNNEIHHN